jgi:NitT/TauT family transport system substrate-binding protein
MRRLTFMQRSDRLRTIWPGALAAALLLLAALALVQPHPSAAQSAPGVELKPVTVKVTVIDGPQLYPLHVMETRGIAGKYKLNIEQFPVANPQAQFTVMQTAEFQIGLTGPLTVALMRAQGFKVVCVYSMYRYTNDVIVPVDSPIKTIGDLKGKRIGVFGGPSSATTWLLRLVTVRAFGFDVFKDAKMQFSAPPLLAGLLEKGDLDAIMALDPFVLNLLLTKKYRIIGNIGQIWRETSGQEPMVVAVAMNETWAKANPDAARRFVAAYKEATEYLRANDDVWPDLAKRWNITTQEGIDLLRARTVPNLLTRWDGKFLDDQHAFLAEVIRVFGDAEGMPKQIPPGTFDTNYAP